MTTTPPGGSPPPDSGDAPDDSTPVFTRAELDAARQQATAEARRHFDAKASAKAPTAPSTSASLEQLVQLQIAQALGALTPKAAAPPPMAGSAPPSRAVTGDTPILDMAVADREALLERDGPVKFAARLQRELAKDGRRFSLRRR